MKINTWMLLDRTRNRPLYFSKNENRVWVGIYLRYSIFFNDAVCVAGDCSQTLDNLGFQNDWHQHQ